MAGGLASVVGAALGGPVPLAPPSLRPHLEVRKPKAEASKDGGGHRRHHLDSGCGASEVSTPALVVRDGPSGLLTM